jgi:hypothetical protein
MTVTKIATVTFRIKPEIKAALCEAAEREQRSLANMLEVMIRDYSSRYFTSDADAENTKRCPLNVRQSS